MRSGSLDLTRGLSCSGESCRTVYIIWCSIVPVQRIQYYSTIAHVEDFTTLFDVCFTVYDIDGNKRTHERYGSPFVLPVSFRPIFMLTS